MGFLETLEAIEEMDAWAEAHLPGQRGHRILIERAGNGGAIIEVLQEYLPGRIGTSTPRRQALESKRGIRPGLKRNVFLPGTPNEDLTGFDPANTPHDTQELVAELVAFPGGRNDDQVDALGYALNHLTTRSGRGAWNL